MLSLSHRRREKWRSADNLSMTFSFPFYFDELMNIILNFAMTTDAIKISQTMEKATSHEKFNSRTTNDKKFVNVNVYRFTWKAGWKKKSSFGPISTSQPTPTKKLARKCTFMPNRWKMFFFSFHFSSVLCVPFTFFGLVCFFTPRPTCRIHAKDFPSLIQPNAFPHFQSLQLHEKMPEKSHKIKVFNAGCVFVWSFADRQKRFRW